MPEVLTANRPNNENAPHQPVQLDQPKHDTIDDGSQHNYDREFSLILEGMQEDEVELKQLKKTAELAKHFSGKDDADDRRRGLVAIYGEDSVKDMNDTDVSAFIADKVAQIHPVITPEQKRGDKKVAVEPTGFPTREEAIEDIQEQGPVRLSFFQTARFYAGAPGRFVWKTYSKLFDKAASRNNRYNAMTPAEQEKLKKRTGLLATMGAAAIGMALNFGKIEHMATDAVNSFASGNAPDTIPDGNRIRGSEEYGPTAAEIKTTQDAHVAEFIYDPAKDYFNKPHDDYNFRPPLDTTTAETAKNDLLEGLKYSPNQLAVMMGASGMIPNDQASIEAAAELMYHDPTAMAANYDQFQELANQAHIYMTEPNSQGYYAYSLVDNGNGTETLAYSFVPHDTQPFLAFGWPGGGDSKVGCHCGQVADVPEFAPVEAIAQPVGTASVEEVVAAAPVAAGNGGGEGSAPMRPLWQPTGTGGQTEREVIAEEPVTTETPLEDQPTGTGPAPQPQPSPQPEPQPQPTPNEDKDYSGGVGPAPGIDPALNQFLGITQDFVTGGNGTGSPNLNPGVAPGAAASDLADGAAPNTASQLGGEAGSNGAAGINRTHDDNAAQQRQAQDRTAQDAANRAADAMESTMGSQGATERAVRDAQSGMGADGRPSN